MGPQVAAARSSFFGEWVAMDDDKVVVGGGLRALGVRLRTGLKKKKKKKDKANIMHEIHKYNNNNNKYL